MESGGNAGGFVSRADDCRVGDFHHGDTEARVGSQSGWGLTTETQRHGEDNNVSVMIQKSVWR